MTADREHELEATILALTTENKVLRGQVRGLQRDLDHATGDVVAKMASDVSYCRRILAALNHKMILVDDEELEEPHGQEDHGAARDGRRR